MTTPKRSRRKRSSRPPADGAAHLGKAKSSRRWPADQRRRGRPRGTEKGDSGSHVAPAELSEDVKRHIEGMSAEDTAAYLKVQVLGREATPPPQKHRTTSSKHVSPKTSKEEMTPESSKKSVPANADKSARKRKKTRRSTAVKSEPDTRRAKGPAGARALAGKPPVKPPQAEKPTTGKSSVQPDDGKLSRVREGILAPAASTPDRAAPAVRSDEQARPSASKREAPRQAGKPVPRHPQTGPGREMVINSASGDECRIAILYERKLEEFFIERSSAVSHVGNIYKGRIANVEASIQAAFIDFGLHKHGFLHISDVQPQYFSKDGAEPEGVGRKVPRRDRPPIQTCFKRGQEVIVQVIKEGLGTKGPTLSTYLSIPGRYLVMMPGMTRLGVSRKIEDEETRRTMRSVLSELTLPKDMGFILRTSGEGRTKRDLQRDLTYLHRLWKLVAERVRSTKAPAELYRESDLVIRTIRDVFTADFDRIIVDTPETAKNVREFLRIALPRTPERIVEEYDGRVPIFHYYGIEDQIEAIHARHVPLKSGGSIVIDQTEAMVAIDVNSGRMRNVGNEEEMAFKTDIEAAQEIARQLRLRDLGGLIVCDFIDMRLDRHKRAVERELREALKKHKERARILRMSQFGLIEMTRQRQGPSIKRGIYTDCPHCKGSGLVKSPESMTLHVLRNVQKAVYHDDIVKLAVTVSPDVAYVLQNRKRHMLHQLEMDTEKSITIRSEPSFTWDQHEYEAEDFRGRKVSLFSDK
ncbi:MAG: Rne/Rng family ribonuclease [Phycisphaerae bacterium]